MSCPQCGGSARDEIAPGFWRCRSMVQVSDPHDPHARQGYVDRVCGAEYQEGPPPDQDAICGCRTFAIGYCADCAVPVCGVHSGLLDGVRVCGNCYQARIDRQKAAELDASRARTVIEWDEIPSDPLVQAASIIGWRHLIFGGPRQVRQTGRSIPQESPFSGPSDPSTQSPWHQWPGAFVDEAPSRARQEELVLDPAVVAPEVSKRLRRAGVSASWTIEADRVGKHQSAAGRRLRNSLDVQKKFNGWVAVPPALDLAPSTQGRFPTVGVSEDGRQFEAWDLDEGRQRAKEAHNGVGSVVTSLILLLDADALAVPAVLLEGARFDDLRRARFFIYRGPGGIRGSFQ